MDLRRRQVARFGAFDSRSVLLQIALAIAAVEKHISTAMIMATDYATTVNLEILTRCSNACHSFSVTVLRSGTYRP